MLRYLTILPYPVNSTRSSLKESGRFYDHLEEERRKRTGQRLVLVPAEAAHQCRQHKRADRPLPLPSPRHLHTIAASLLSDRLSLARVERHQQRPYNRYSLMLNNPLQPLQKMSYPS